MILKDPSTRLIKTTDDTYYQNIMIRRESQAKQEQLEAELLIIKQELKKINELINQKLSEQQN